MKGGLYSGSVPPVGHSGKSLKVDQNLQIWHDTKNGVGGDVLDWFGRGFVDPRGKDFYNVLRTAAEMAGVELAEMTAEEKERVDVYNLLTDATEIYHRNLTPELYDTIMKKWGITQETVYRLKIGYATTGKDTEHLNRNTLQKSGLIYSNVDQVVFNCRIMFPYWKNGKVVYLIGRSTQKTPCGKDDSDPPKYKKLLVQSDKFLHVKVHNSYFYGEDSLRGADNCIITEGVTDCIVMLQAGFPCYHLLQCSSGRMTTKNW
jgi:DNA primase